MNDGEAAIELSCPTTGRVVCLLPWRTNSGSENTLSTSQELPPALAIGIYTPEKPSVVLLFDPKYNVAESAEKAVAKKTQAKTTQTKIAQAKTKAGKSEIVETLSAIEPMKEDIDQLLRRMDQIRAPEGVSETQYAAILYPGQRKQIASNVEALPARPSDGEALQKNIYDVLRRYLA
jgi:hypothetical protein